MKNLTATICLTLAVLLGSVVVNYASSKDLTQETEGLPYWAGHQAILNSLATDENFEGHISLSMKYSQDGKIYYANGSYVRFPALFDCTGKIDEEGNLEEQDCTPSSWWGYKRTLMGHVTNPIIENSGHGTTAGGEFPDKELLRNETAQKLARECVRKKYKGC